jgi:hypothetical protein
VDLDGHGRSLPVEVRRRTHRDRGGVVRRCFAVPDCTVAIRAIVAPVPETRYIGRANLAKRLRPLEGTPGRSTYEGGSARFALDEATLTVTPPFGLAHEGDYDVLRVAPLLQALEAEATVAVLIARLGGYAVGVFEGERLVASKVGSRFVKGRHKKGGSSANRFRRRRGEQERELVDAGAAEAARVLGPWRERAEHAALGGDRTTVSRILAARPDLGWIQRLVLDRFFDVPEPRLRVLETLPYQLYAAKVVEEPL